MQFAASLGGDFFGRDTFGFAFVDLLHSTGNLRLPSYSNLRRRVVLDTFENPLGQLDAGSWREPQGFLL